MVQLLKFEQNWIRMLLSKRFLTSHHTMLSYKESTYFLQDILGINSIQEKFTKDKVGLLNEITTIYRQKIPFQSITVISRPEEDQHLSTLDDIKTQIFNTQGGLCYEHNIFMKYLLEVLGYEVYLNACDIDLNGVYSHLSVLVKNLVIIGDKYHVDVGSGINPIFQAIPLDFKQESPIYRCGYQIYKFRKEGDYYSWWHDVTTKSYLASHKILEEDFILEGWKKHMLFTLEPKEMDYFTSHMMRHYVTQTPPLPGYNLLDHMRAEVFPEQRLVAIRGTSLLREDEDGVIEKTKIRSKEKLVRLYGEYFPQLPTEMVNVAADKMDYNYDL